MTLFDVNKYKVPDMAKVNMKATRENFDVFLSAYEQARERVGHCRIPKITQSFEIAPVSTLKEYDGDAQRFIIEREEALPDFKELHMLFMQGYSAIQKPTKPYITERRRNVFVLRYLNGKKISAISERIYLSRDVVIEESQISLVQFCNAIQLIVLKKEIPTSNQLFTDK